jgi:hypothetical protein
MWIPDDVDDVFADIRLAFGQRYAAHLADAARQVFAERDDFRRLGALWVQQVLQRGRLLRDCDHGMIVLRLPIGSWTFDFAFGRDGQRTVTVGDPDSLFRDGVPVDVGHFDAADLRRLREAIADDDALALARPGC